MNIYPFIFIILLLPRLVFADPWQSLASIEQAIQAYVNTAIVLNNQDRFDIRPLDSRLQLALCDQALVVNATAGELKAGNNTLLIHCPAQQNWKIYSAVNIKIFREVVMLNKSLKRGDVIHAEDLVMEYREVSGLPSGYITDTNQVINKQAARNIIIGSALNAQSYQDAAMIKRGDQVHIQSSNSNFSISMTGIAMSNGSKGESIKVKNLSSQKQLQAVVINTGLVSVNF